MSSPRITFTYELGGDVVEPRLALEQLAVPKGNLSLTDLSNMFALAKSGISAYTYIIQECPASLVNGRVIVPLTLFVWPSVPNLAYTLTSAVENWTTIAAGAALEQERDFDLVIPEANAVDLPCLAAGLQLDWQTPAITPFGVVVDKPEIEGYDPALKRWAPITAASGPINRLRFDREIFGVLRVRCRALGYRHPLTMSIPKTGDQKLTDIEESITAAWKLSDDTTETATIDLVLPGCVASLLEACEDDPSRTPGGSDVNIDQEELIPEMRYSTCDGLPIGVVRYVPAVKPGEEE